MRFVWVTQVRALRDTDTRGFMSGGHNSQTPLPQDEEIHRPLCMCLAGTTSTSTACVIHSMLQAKQYTGMMNRFPQAE